MTIRNDSLQPAPPLSVKARRTIAFKLSIGFGLLLLLLAIMSVVAYLNMNTLDREVDHLINFADRSQAFRDIETAFFIALEGEADYLATQNPEAIQEMAEGEAAWKEALVRLETLGIDAEEQAFKRQLEDLLGRALTSFARVRALVDAGDIEAAKSHHRTVVESLADEIEILFTRDVRTDIAANRLQAKADADRSFATGVTLIIGLGLGAVGLGFFAATRISRSIVNPVRRLTNVAQTIAQGDLDTPVDIQSSDEVELLAEAFGTMTDRLRDTLAGLEGRVAERTRALEISSQVSRRLSTILDERELVSEVVNQVRAAFDYYYAHIYVLDETGQTLNMAGGTGEAGRVMLGRGHSIPVGKGLVGRAAETNTVVLVPDVSQEKGWLPNPLLPDTKAEVAVPIAVGEQVLGVLDVQHDVVGGLGRAEADLIQSIANQVAVAMQNARSYDQAQRRAEREALATAIGQKIQRATTVDRAMQIAVRELGRVVGGHTRVRLTAARNANE